GVYGRQSVWSNATIQEMVKAFVPAADEVHSLFNGRGPEAELFQALAKQGFAGGKADFTQQGFYCLTPSGRLLCSDNTRDPARAARLLELALSRWNALPEGQRYRSELPSAE